MEKLLPTLKTAYITKLVDNWTGSYIVKHAQMHGVDMSNVVVEPFDKIGRVRNGLAFVEVGIGPRASYQIYDRGHSALSYIKPGDIDWENAAAAFRRKIDARLLINAKDRKKNNAKMLRLFLIGLAFVAVGIALSVRLDAVPTELLSIIGSFAVWEAANIWIVQNPQNRMERRLLTRLAESEIHFEVKDA